MVQVINGKRYDTDKAELVCDYEFSNPSDFRHVYEALYRTAKGNWFLYGVGGPMSRYAVSLGDNSTGGSEDIVPMSADEALEFLESHDGVDGIERYFADSIEDA